MLKKENYSTMVAFHALYNSVLRQDIYTKKGNGP